MNILSFSRHLKIIIVPVLLRVIRGQVFVLCLAGFLRFGGVALGVTVGFSALTGCYSFTGGSIPPHLKTLSIPIAEDNSVGGSAQMRENLTQLIVQAFRRENAFTLVQDRADAVLEVTITGLTENLATVATGELERDKQIMVNVSVVYQDRVKQKQIWVKQFAPPQTFSVASGLQGRDAAIERALRQIANDILLAVVSGW
ncbi:MAG: LPS assembly lipoprotein LptE [Candidatus Kapabacteria bacterium]|jgi:hypothetical protein|nr:LPS assembly lipoprotein LptE [Candidatus Kapabacteria bacterium]